MPEMSRLLSLQGQLALLTLVGFVLTKKGLIDAKGRKCLTDLVIDVILPCNIIQSFRIEFSWEIMQSTFAILLVSILLQVGCAVACALGYKRYPYARRAVFQYGTVCSNAGFLGNPLAEGIFGSTGLLLTSIYLIPQRIAMWSMGVSYFMADSAPASAEEKKAQRKAVFLKTIRHPCIVAVFFGMFLLLTQLPLPGFLGTTVKSISNCNMAMSMILIGAIIGSSENLRPILDKDVFFYCLIRLGIIPLLVLLGCRAAHTSELVNGVAVVLAAMPMGGTTAILAEKYHCDSAFASKCVAISTILSLITTPLWCMVV